MADDKDNGAVIALVCIILGIAIPIIAFWVLIIWCSRRKRKRMADFHKTPELPTPVAEDVEAAAEPKEPKEEEPEAKGNKSSKSAAKSAKSGKSAKDEGTGTDAGKTGDGKTGE